MAELQFEPWQAALVVLLAGLSIWVLFFRQSKDYGKQLQQLQPKRPREKKVYSKEEVAKHNSRTDAWIVVRHKDSGEWRVYDVTEYIDEHPGGDSILRNVGRDSTDGFHGPQHPATVFDLVEEYCIGTLEQ